ncbi:MAG: hypothetical protein RLZZ293_556 [Pseudomonadota bacterium]|jgi:multiple antibiotic resistance protein
MQTTMDSLTYQHFLIGIFAVANNFPAVGPFLKICDGLDRSDQLRLCKTATMTSVIVMFVALTLGHMILSFFGISIDAFRIAGGILLCSSGMRMMHSKPHSEEENQSSGGKNSYSKVISLAVIPIAIPLTTGAGTFSTIIIFSDEVGRNWAALGLLVAAILTVALAIYFIFRSATRLLDLLGHTGMDVLIKVVGLFTLALGTQFIIAGTSSAFPGLIS